MILSEMCLKKNLNINTSGGNSFVFQIILLVMYFPQRKDISEEEKKYNNHDLLESLGDG